MENVTIKTTRCDSCNRRGPCGEWDYNGIPHIANCRSCDPHSFEAAARRDVDAWLAGGKAVGFGF